MEEVITVAVSELATYDLEMRRIENDWKPMYEIVGGYIEMVPIISTPEGAIYLVCDEEGKIKNKLPNVALKEKDKSEIDDIVVGTIFYTKVDSKGENISLTLNDIKLIQKWQQERKLFPFMT